MSTETDYEAQAAAPVVPWSSEAEQSVLGAVLLDNQAVDRVADILTAQAFWSAPHRLIWTAVCELVMASKPADPITVLERLQAKGEADAAGGLAYLSSLMNSVPSASNCRRYAEIVAERAARRAAIEAAKWVAA